MSYLDLAKQLQTVGGQLERHASTLKGNEPAKIAKALATQLAKLAKLLAAGASQDTPEMRRLSDLISTHAGDLGAAGWASLGKLLEWKVPKAGTASARGDKLLETAAKSGNAAAAVAWFEHFAQVKSRPAADLSNEENRRAEIRRLGAGTEEQIALELETSFDDAQVRALASAAGLKVGPKTLRKKLLPDLIHYVRRHYLNTVGAGV